LWWKADALYAILSLVSPKTAETVAGAAVPRNLRTLRVVGRFAVLDVLPVV
jgi:hypothetical protein